MIFKSIQDKFTISTILTGLIVLMLVALPAYSSEKGADIGDDNFPYDGEGIFTDVPYSEAAPYLSETQGHDAKVKRSRLVKIDFDKLFKARNNGKRSAHKFIPLNLFDDVNFNARVDKVNGNRSGSATWIATGTGKSKANAHFTLKDNIMIGSFTKGSKTFAIRYVGGDIHEIQETVHGMYPGCEEPEAANSLDSLQHLHENLDSAQADSGATIDVLVVYTATARSGAGGTTAMNTLIDQAVSESNTGYGNSSVNPRLNLVHKAEVTYSESSFNWSTCLNRLVGTSDGYMDSVHTLRNTYNADVVVLIVNNQSYCGLANAIMASASGAFCLVSRVCATGYYSFAHEIGHLQGARHDRYVDNTDYSPYTYNHGYTYSTAYWRTIMAYNNACSAVGRNCTRLNYWSNPNVLYGGVAMGNSGGAGSGADNHLCLNNTAYTVANFRLSGGGGVTYCTSSGNNQSYEWIAGVAIASINKTSGASGYSDYTSTSTNMTRSSSVSVTLTPGFGSGSYNEYWRIWIDYNQDGDFDDSGEQVFSGYSSGNTTGSFTVSSSASTGNTRMRVVMQYNSYRSSACGTFTYGEVEDYTVNIQ